MKKKLIAFSLFVVTITNAQTNMPVTGNLTVDGNSTLGNAATDIATVNGDFTVYGKAVYEKTFTDITSAGTLFRASALMNPTGENNQRVVGISGRSESAGSQNLTRTINQGAALTGLEGIATHGGAGTVASAVGLAGTVVNNSTGNLSMSVALVGRAPGGTGTKTDAYGLYLENQKNSSVTGKGYGVYSAGTSTMNVFAGRMRIGDSTDPGVSTALDVTGNAAISGTLSVGGNQLPPVGSILTSSAADSAYHKRLNDQIILGTHAAADADAALLVGSGSSETPANVLTISKSGDLNVTGNANLDSLISGSTTVTTLGVSGVAGFADAVSISGDTSVTSLSASGPFKVGASNSVGGFGSSAIGANLTVSGAHQFVVGRYNENEDPNTNGWSGGDPLFVVANGADAEHPNNALVVRKDGLVKIGDIEIDPVARVVRVPESGDIDMGGYQ